MIRENSSFSNLKTRIFKNIQTMRGRTGGIAWAPKVPTRTGWVEWVRITMHASLFIWISLSLNVTIAMWNYSEYNILMKFSDITNLLVSLELSSRKWVSIELRDWHIVLVNLFVMVNVNLGQHRFQSLFCILPWGIPKLYTVEIWLYCM